MQLPDAIEAIRPAVVQIRATGPGAAPQGDLLGTGFIVAEGVVITAKHVVDGVDVGAGQTLHVAFAGPEIDTPQIKMRANFTGTAGSVRAVAAEHDLALVDVPGAAALTMGVQIGTQLIESKPGTVRLSTTKIREGTAVAVSGYPLNEPSLVTTAGVLASSFSPVSVAGGFQERHLGDFTANPGNSGGPVYSIGDARVVGVCVAGKLAPITGGIGQHAAGLTVIVPAVEVLALLQRENVPLQTSSESAGRGSQSRGRKRRRR